MERKILVAEIDKGMIIQGKLISHLFNASSSNSPQRFGPGAEANTRACGNCVLCRLSVRVSELVNELSKFFEIHQDLNLGHRWERQIYALAAGTVPPLN